MLGEARKQETGEVTFLAVLPIRFELCTTYLSPACLTCARLYGILFNVIRYQNDAALDDMSETKGHGGGVT